VGDVGMVSFNDAWYGHGVGQTWGKSFVKIAFSSNNLSSILYT